MNALGLPGKGFHVHVLGIPIFDVIGTIAIAWLTAYLTNTSLLWNFVGWFILGEILHWYFGVQTAFMRLLR